MFGRRTGTRAATLLALVQLCVAPAAAQSGAALRGVVTDARSGAAIVSAQVVVRDAQGTIVTGTMTGADGRFAILKVAAGVYAVEANRLGYERTVRGDVRVDAKDVELALSLQSVALKTQAVVVTATRRVVKVADSDVSAHVISGARLAARNEPTLFGALRKLGGVDVFESGLGQQQANARGFVNPFTTNMLVLVDGRLATLPGLGVTLPGMLVAPQNDIAQVEVVTGPSSALFGANAANGVINIVTREPRESAGGSLSVGSGERSMFTFGARVAEMLTSTVGFKVSAERFQARDFERVNSFTNNGTVFVKDVPDFDVAREALNGALYLYPGDGSRLAVSGGVSRANYINLSVAGRLQVKDWDTWYTQVRGTGAHVLGGTLYGSAAYTRNDAGGTYYLDVLARSQIPTTAGGTGLSYAAAMARAHYIDRSDRMEYELQHTLRLSASQILTTGAMYRSSRPVSDGTYLTDGPTGEAIKIDESGAYVGYDNLVTPKLRLSGVARYDTHSDFSGRFSPKLSAVYTRDNGHTLRLIYNEAFNSPNFYLLYAKSAVGRDALGYTNWIRGNRQGFTFVNLKGGAVPAPIKALQPLHVSSLELGYRATLGGTASLDFTAYRTAYRNYISKEATIGSAKDSIFAVDPKTGLPLKENTRTYLNYGELPVMGVEASADWLPVPRWSVEGVFAYQQPGTFKKPVAGLTPPGFNAPTHKLKGSVAFHDFAGLGSRIELSANRISRFDFVSSLAYLTGPVPEYTTADLQATIPVLRKRGARTSVNVAIRNLFDHEHIEVPGGAPLGRLASLTLSADW